MTMFIRRGDPFREALTLRDAMNRLIEDSFVRPTWSGRTDGGSESTLRLPLDAYSTQDEIVIVASVPGLKPESVEITLEGETLTISGEVPAPLENVNYFLQERAFGRFSRQLIVNVPIDADKASADFDNGRLTITIPKAEAVRPRAIKVTQK
jgi:HSP20 family protein